jgi:carboxyl-terminal processing protease
MQCNNHDPHQPTWLVAAGLLSLSLLSACGGGGGQGSADVVDPVKPSPTSRELAQICAPDNPYLADASGATTRGTLADEKSWIRAYMNERYLWYRDIPVLDAAAPRYNLSDTAGKPQVVASLVNYFQDSRSPRLTASGNRVDQFSFMIDSYSWSNFSSGQQMGYGWMLKTTGSGAGERTFVSYVYPTSQAGLAFGQGILRGDEIVSVDGLTPRDSDPSRFYAALSPDQAGSHDFVFLRQGQTIRKTLQALNVEVPQAEHRIVSHNGVRWGYLMFNSHVKSAEPALVSAVDDFQSRGIDELVVDLRYNSGGYLAIASALARAVAGPVRTENQVFETTRFNDKRTSENFSMGFYPSTLFTGATYRTLDLGRVYVLTSDETCSASESFINGLRGVDVQVVQIGGTTCGKPYGFYPQDNCGITYAAMEFEGVNAKGEGGFSDGMAPTCVAQDSLEYPLADPREHMFATAAAHRAGKTCPAVAAARALGGSSTVMAGVLPPSRRLVKDWQRNKIITRP